MNRDLSLFQEDNAFWRRQKKRVPWDQRLALIEEQFPHVRDPEWNVILQDPDVFGRLLRDILKIDQIEPGRAGPRPGLDYERGMQSWREMTGEDFAEQPFAQAFRALSRQHSYRQIARKTGLEMTRIHRLMNGRGTPSVEELRACAAAYNKKPAYFAEYRAEYIMAAIAARLENESDVTIAVYTRLMKASS